MTKLHLNYDGKQNNGIIFNDKYTNGAMYLGAELKPNTTFSYDSMQYSEVFEGLNYVEISGTKRVMTAEEEAEIIAIATAWVQPLGQEGNPTLEQAKRFKLDELNNSFNVDVANITTALPHEMVSWRKQEEEARAYLVDNTVATSFIDALMVTRNLGETKSELVAKIISNADVYESMYASLLGKFQNLSKAISICTSVEEIEGISW